MATEVKVEDGLSSTETGEPTLAISFPTITFPAGLGPGRARAMVSATTARRLAAELLAKLGPLETPPSETPPS